MKDFLRIGGVNKFVCVRFKLCAAVIFLLACSAEYAPPIFPRVVYALKSDIAFGIFKLTHRKLAVGVFAAINAPA